jgi:hypothetical protein
LADSVALLERLPVQERSDVRAHRPGLRPRATAAARRQPPGVGRGATTAKCWAASCGSCTPAGRGGISPGGLALADLLQPAASLAAGRNLAEDLGGVGRRRTRLNRRPPRPTRPAGAGGGASDSGGRGPGGGDATTTTTAPAAPLAASTTPAQSAGGVPLRSRSSPGPSLEVVAVLRAQPPPAPARVVLAAWARTAARNAWATSTRVVYRYQAS